MLTRKSFGFLYRATLSRYSLGGCVTAAIHSPVVKTIIRSFFVLFLCTAALAARGQTQAGAPSLIGVWELQGTREDGTGSVYTFRPDGVLVITSSLMSDFDAQAEGNELRASAVDSRGHAESVRIHASANSLNFQQKGQPESWIRVGPAVAGQPAFAGLWAIDQSAPSERKRKNDEISQLIRQNMRLRITPVDAIGKQWKVRMRCPIENSGGSYTVQGTKIIMQFSGKVWVASYRMQGNNLYLTRQGETSDTIFERAE